MEQHSEKYLEALYVVDHWTKYDYRDYVDAKRYVNAYMDGYNQAIKKPSTPPQPNEPSKMADKNN